MYLSKLLKKKSAWPPNIKKLNSYFPYDNNKNIGRWFKFFNTTESTLSTVIGTHQAFIDKGLVVLTNILDDVKPGDTIDRRTGKYYVVLA